MDHEQGKRSIPDRGIEAHRLKHQLELPAQVNAGGCPPKGVPTPCGYRAPAHYARDTIRTALGSTTSPIAIAAVGTYRTR